MANPRNATTTDLTGTPLDPRQRTPHRPYARKRGGPPSVTGIIGAQAKDGLQWGAAKENALFAVHHYDEWCDLEQPDAVNRIRKHFKGVWDGRAALGTLVHDINEAWTWGEDADVPPEAIGYVDGLERFWKDHDPQTIATEEVVRQPDVLGLSDYIGQRDWTAVIRGERYLLDIKTTAEQNPDKGFYVQDWRLQLAAYRFAAEVVTYDENGKESSAVENYPVDRCGIVHLRGDGKYQLLEVQAGPAEHAVFLQLRGVWQWWAKDHKSPLPVIHEGEVVVA